MLDQQPRERMPAIWGLADASIVHLRRTPLFRTVIPSKIFEAMAAGVPTLLGVEGEAVWTQEYLRYRVNRCGHTDSINKVFQQIDGRGIAATC